MWGTAPYPCETFITAYGIINPLSSASRNLRISRCGSEAAGHANILGRSSGDYGAYNAVEDWMKQIYPAVVELPWS